MLLLSLVHRALIHGCHMIPIPAVDLSESAQRGMRIFHELATDQIS
jgi:hypothetical protein